MNGALQAGFSYAPDANFNGTDQLVLDAHDDQGGTAQQKSYIINVVPVNDAPQLTPAPTPVSYAEKRRRRR